MLLYIIVKPVNKSENVLRFFLKKKQTRQPENSLVNFFHYFI